MKFWNSLFLNFPVHVFFLCLILIWGQQLSSPANTSACEQLAVIFSGYDTDLDKSTCSLLSAWGNQTRCDSRISHPNISLTQIKKNQFTVKTRQTNSIYSITYPCSSLMTQPLAYRWACRLHQVALKDEDIGWWVSESISARCVCVWAHVLPTVPEEHRSFCPGEGKAHLTGLHETSSPVISHPKRNVPAHLSAHASHQCTALPHRGLRTRPKTFSYSSSDHLSLSFGNCSAVDFMPSELEEEILDSHKT